jgi:hypothetical protein
MVSDATPEQAGHSGWPELAPGQEVWVDGRRQATFTYELVPGTAVIRYAGERRTRVVPRGKLAPAPARRNAEHG